MAFDKSKSYTHDPAETVELVEDGLDTVGYSSDELAPVVYDLLYAGRVDLALPLFERFMDMSDATERLLLRYINHYGTALADAQQANGNG